jgi:hypothetical protein
MNPGNVALMPMAAGFLRWNTTLNSTSHLNDYADQGRVFHWVNTVGSDRLRSMALAGRPNFHNPEIWQNAT